MIDAITLIVMSLPSPCIVYRRTTSLRRKHTGIDPDFRIHIADRLLEMHDGPFLELGLKSIAGSLIATPRRRDDWPDRDRLALRSGA